jgi:hypothetical protein
MIPAVHVTEAQQFLDLEESLCRLVGEVRDVRSKLVRMDGLSVVARMLAAEELGLAATRLGRAVAHLDAETLQTADVVAQEGGG